MLTLGNVCSFCCESRYLLEMQTGNGSASACAHWISVTGVGFCAGEVIGLARALLKQRIDQRVALRILRGRLP